MAREVKLPELGENVKNAEIVSVLVHPGDRVEKDQPILEIETDKSTIEVPSDVSGVVSEVLVEPGTKAMVGQALLRIDEEGSVARAGAAPPQGAAAPAEPAQGTERTEPTRQAEAPREPAQAAPPVAAGAPGVREVRLPSMGENVGKADVVSVLVKPGDRIEKDQAILEVETDKASFEVPSDTAGTVQEVLVQAGEKARAGQAVLLVMADADTPARGQKYPVRPETPVRPDVMRTENPRTEMPRAPERRPGGPPAQARPLAPAHRQEDTNGKGRPARPWSPKSEPGVEAARKAVPAAPSVRRIARQLGLEISEVQGTGPRGRISVDDLLVHNRKLVQEASRRPARAAEIEAPELPDFAQFGPVVREEMSSIRRATARGMSRAWTQIPHVTQHDKADVTELEILRKRYAERVQKAGGKLTMTAILLKVLASGLKAFPQFNASLDMAGEAVVYKKYFHLGVAVDTKRGLLVPVVRDVDQKNLVDLSVALAEMSNKAKNRKIRPDDLQGACMTVTNLGGIGGTAFTPIVNWPEVAILGVSRTQVEPVWIEGAFQPRTMLPLSLSYDHRLIDGADAARFLRWVCQALENPFQLLLEG